jgi:hypothetical protein
MKKSIAAQQPRRHQSDTNAVLGEDLGTFLRILVNLSATLRDLGYPEEGEMLIGVKADILERLHETATFPN